MPNATLTVGSVSVSVTPKGRLSRPNKSVRGLAFAYGDAERIFQRTMKQHGVEDVTLADLITCADFSDIMDAFAVSHDPMPNALGLSASDAAGFRERATINKAKKASASA